jgi:hypothetical protein
MLNHTPSGSYKIVILYMITQTKKRLISSSTITLIKYGPFSSLLDISLVLNRCLFLFSEPGSTLAAARATLGLIWVVWY